MKPSLWKRLKDNIKSKKMQTNVCIFLLFCVLFAFEGCIIIPRYRRYEIAAEDVLSIDIYDLREVQERTGSVKIMV